MSNSRSISMLFVKIVFLLIFTIEENVMCNSIKVSQLHDSSNVVQSKKSECGTIKEKQEIPIQLRLPILDMEIQGDRSIHVMQGYSKQQQTFLMHGNELFLFNVSRSEKRMFLIGTLSGSVRDIEPAAAEVISWHDYIILVISLEDFLEIYQLPNAVIDSRAKATKVINRGIDRPPLFEPIQQITLHGRLRKLFLFNPNPEAEEAMIIVAMNFTKLFSKLQTFFWTNTYFEQVEEVTTPPIHEVYVVGHHTKYLVYGRLIKHQSKIILSVDEISATKALRKVQTLTVNSKSVIATTYGDKSYLVACTIQQAKCNMFRMIDGVFSFYKQRPSKELAFNQLQASKHFLVAAIRNQILIYTNARLDCYTSFSSNIGDVHSIVVQNKEYVMLIYKRPFRTLVRILEVATKNGTALGSRSADGNEAEDTSPMSHHQHLFEDIVGKLRSLLLRRKQAIDLFLSLSVRLKPNEFRVSYPVNIHGGRVGTVKIIGTNLHSPMQLRARLNEMRSKYRSLRRLQRSTTDENRNITQKVSAQKLYVNNLEYQGNLIEDKNVSVPSLLSLRAKQITTNNLNTLSLLIRNSLKRISRQDGDAVNITTPSDSIKSRKLIVRNINDVNWDEFYDGLFIRKRDTKMHGKLILQAATNATRLQTQLLNGFIIEKLFNLKEPQNIESNLLISGFFVTDLQAESVNGLNFAEDIVFRGNQTFVETPVVMFQASIAKDLLLGDNITAARGASDESAPQFQQHYTGRVTIKGSLKALKSFKKNSLEKSDVLIDGKPFSALDLEESFFLKNKSQNFKQPIIFGNSKVTVSALNSSHLHGLPIKGSFLLTSAKPNASLPLLLAFKKANVNGDLTTDDPFNRLANLSRNAVYHGEVANITGHKIFETPLEIDHLKTLTLNATPVSDLIIKSQLQKPLGFKDTKTFIGIDVSNSTSVENNLDATHMNQMPLEDLLNYEYNIDSVFLPYKLYAKNIVFDNINDMPLEKLFKKFNLHDGLLFLHKDLIIEGNAHFTKNLNVTNINDIHWPSYQANLARVDVYSNIETSVCFMNCLSISKSLDSPSINNIQMHKVFSNIFRKFQPQEITGVYTFKKVHCTNLDVPLINNVPTVSFIDVRTNEINVDSDVIASEVNVRNNVSGEFMKPLFLKDLNNKLIELTTRHWFARLVVYGNTTWDAEIDTKQTELLAYLYKNAVQTNGSHTITGNMQLSNPFFSKMAAKATFLQDIDFDYLAADSLLRNSRSKDTQIVAAPKVFLMSLHTKCSEANTKLETYLLNGIDVSRFDTSLYHLSSAQTLKAEIYFKTPPVIGHLMVFGDINNVQPSNIYQQSDEILVPSVEANNLKIMEKIPYIGNVNGINISNLLKDRLVKDGTEQEVYGTLAFDNLVLDGRAAVKAVNDIVIDDLVVKKGRNLQTVLGSKNIAGSLLLRGPLSVRHLNGREVADAYLRSVLVDRNHYFDRVLVDEATLGAGLIFTNLLGSTPSISRTAAVDDAVNRRVAEKMLKITKFNEIANEMKKVGKVADNNAEARELFYLDYVPDLEIIAQSAPDNVTLDRVLTFVKPGPSLCERELLQVQIAKPVLVDKRHTIYLSNKTSLLLSAHLNDLSVKAENYCQKKYRKVKSKITITSGRFFKVIGMKKYIQDVSILATNSSEYFIVLHAVDLVHNRHEIRLLKLSNDSNDSLIDWQSMTLGIGHRTMTVFQNNGRYTLISSASNGRHTVLAIYDFVPSDQKFKLSQNIGGRYDIIQMVSYSTATKKNKENQLLLSCKQCQSISIYKQSAEARESESKYEILQVLKLDMPIDKICTFTLSKTSDSTVFMLFSSEHDQDYYHVYKFSHIEGWQHVTHGYFQNIEMALPLNVALQENGVMESTPVEITDLLLLLCSPEKCSVVEAIVK